MDFVKYHGTGNDFILIDDRQGNFPESESLIAGLCNRHYGIGADGILLLRETIGFDFEMVYFNSDGSAATFCGNGGRCMVAFAQSLGIIEKDCSFIAADGSHTARILKETEGEFIVKLQMKDAIIFEQYQDGYYLNSGTYHVVQFVDDTETIDIKSAGSKIRYDTKYAPHGTNVNFVKQIGDTLIVRTYEKGVEAETLSCGTGVTASAVAASMRSGRSVFAVETKGGNLQVSLTNQQGQLTGIFLQGPAQRVFEGKITI